MTFKRDNRYIVMKLADVAAGIASGRITHNDQFQISAAAELLDASRADHGKQPLTGVFVEADWPEYEIVWALIEARVNGNPQPDTPHHNGMMQLSNKLEAAERERDELRAGRDTLQRAVDNLDAERDVLRAELARRDAAASEPVALQVLGDSGKWMDCRSREFAEAQGFVEFRKLYTAAPPAVLPPEMKPEPEKYDVIDHGFIAGYNQCRADALALGAQPAAQPFCFIHADDLQMLATSGQCLAHAPGFIENGTDAVALYRGGDQ